MSKPKLVNLVIFGLTAFLAFSLCGRCFAQSQPLLQITSPADGTVVHPGQTITITVAPASGASFVMVGIVAENPIVEGQYLAAPPYQFSITIPKSISARKYHIQAQGVISRGHGADSPLINLDVEPGAPMSSLRVQPSVVIADFAGENHPLAVWGDFSDGSTMNITNASGTTYSGGNPTVATVNSNGVVTVANPAVRGYVAITVQYGNQKAVINVSTTRLPASSTSATLTSLSPTSGAVGTSITLTGTNFGTTQGTSTVTFNGTPGTPTSWSATGIVVPVPSGATTGNVVVTVGGSPSNGLTFTVQGTTSGTAAFKKAHP